MYALYTGRYHKKKLARVCVNISVSATPKSVGALVTEAGWENRRHRQATKLITSVSSNKSHSRYNHQTVDWCSSGISAGMSKYMMGKHGGKLLACGRCRISRLASRAASSRSFWRRAASLASKSDEEGEPLPLLGSEMSVFVVVLSGANGSLLLSEYCWNEVYSSWCWWCCLLLGSGSTSNVSCWVELRACVIEGSWNGLAGSSNGLAWWCAIFVGGVKKRVKRKLAAAGMGPPWMMEWDLPFWGKHSNQIAI